LRFVFGGDQVPITVPDESRAEVPPRELIQALNIPDDEKKHRLASETGVGAEGAGRREERPVAP
jgi:hypothetical protein